LSAILLNDDYYSLVREQHNEEKNLPFANPAALIPLKSRAYLDLAERAAKGEKVKGEDIAKHRTDVFRIAATLPGEAGPAIPSGDPRRPAKISCGVPCRKQRRVACDRRGAEDDGSI
jgi:hypothetical protein